MVMITAEKNTVTLPTSLLRQGGFVILGLDEYKTLQKKAVPTYYLAGGQAKRLDQLVAKGLQAVKLRTTKKIASLADLD